MSATPRAVQHYRGVEEIARAQAVIRELRGELSAVICEIQRTASAIRDVDALIARAKATLSRTAEEPAEQDFADWRDACKELDALSKPERAETLRDVIKDICWTGAGMSGKPPR